MNNITTNSNVAEAKRVVEQCIRNKSIRNPRTPGPDYER